MGVRENLKTKITDKIILQIHGQPSKVAVTALTKGLSKIATTVKTKLGGGKHSHICLVIEDVSYTTFSDGGAVFTILMCPGEYPSTVSDVAAMQAKEEA